MPSSTVLRPLGRSALMAPPLCFGGNVFGWTVDEALAFRLLDALYEAGLAFVDTADVYSNWVPGNVGGESEAIIGRWMKARGNRARVVVATKGGSEMAPDRKGLSKAYVRAAAEASLRRLQTDYIDLYQAHRDDAATPVEETLEALAQLVAEGKVRVIGASNFPPTRLAAALDASERLGLPRYETLQPEYNLYDRAEFEHDYRDLCRTRGLGVLPYFSLARGFLTGKYRSEADLAKSPRGAGVKRCLDARGLRILAALDAVAAARAATPAQVALAWLMARPPVVAPIASATSLAQLADLVAATRLSLSDDDLAALDAASTP